MKRPWNRTNLPVYSVSSGLEEHANMHICTYVSSVSMEPKRYMIAIYKNTKTLENIESTGIFVLQLLSSEQYRLIKLLGKTSGHQINKIEKLENRKELQKWKGYLVLKNALAYIELKTIMRYDAGDHIMFVCDLLSFYNNLPGEALTLDVLREKKLIRG